MGVGGVFKSMQLVQKDMGSVGSGRNSGTEYS